LGLKNLKQSLKSIKVSSRDFVYIQHEDRDSFCKNRFSFLDYTIFLANNTNHKVLYEAYQWSKKPPKKRTLPKNLAVFFSTIEANFAKPITSKENREILRDLRGWDELGIDVFVWHYATNFGGYIQPRPNIYSLAKDIKEFARYKSVKGVFLQGSYDSNGGELEELRTWVFAELLWDPKQDVKRLIKTFCDAYYKESSKYVMRYIELLEKFSEVDKRVYVKSSVELGYLDEKHLVKLERVLDRAYKSAKSKRGKRKSFKTLLWGGLCQSDEDECL